MDFQVLAVRGEGGYRQYRIPAMATTPTGRVLAVYDARPDLDDLPSPIDLVVRTSDDCGATWSAQTVLRRGDDIVGFGDASIVVDPEAGSQGRVLVFAQATRLAGFFEGSVGCDPEDPMVVHIAVSRSDDDGMTWTHDLVTAQLKDERTPGIFVSSGMGGRISTGPHSGRLLITCVLRRGDQLMGSIAYSDDHGLTWTLGAEIPGGNESAIVGLADGSVLLHSRATPFRLTARSHDGGSTVDQVRPDRALPDPSDNGSLCVLSTGAVVCSHNHDSDLRRRTVLKRSMDGGRTWPEAVVIEPGSSAYSTACELPDGRVGVLFERNGYSEMVFCRVDPHDFGPTESVLPSEADDHGISFTIALRFVRPARATLPEQQSAATTRIIPAVDMTVWRPSERKEVGQLGGTSAGEPIHTREELDAILGPVSPGLHVGDEMRFSGRLANHGPGVLTNITIDNSCDGSTIERAVLDPDQRIVFLDVRHTVTAAEVRQGIVEARFTWHGQLRTPESDMTLPISGEVTQRFSTHSGLPEVSVASA
jgi:sialidase-1